MARRLVGTFFAFVLALLAVLLLGTAAIAAGEDFHGTLRNGGEPLAGVRLVVTTTDGAPVGETATDPGGAWAIPLPGAGTYTLTLDTATLPDGVALREGAEATVTRDVVGGQKRVHLFAFGERAVTKPPRFDRALQLGAEGLRFGLILGLAALGMSLIYGTTGLVNFSHGELVTFGAIAAYVINVHAGLQLIGAAVLAVAVCAGVGYLQDVTFWGRLRRRGSGLLAMMIISIGAAIFVRYLYLYFFGSRPKAFDDYGGQPAVDLGDFPIRLAARDYWSMGIAFVVLVLVLVAMARTRLGKAVRAVSDNPSLAAASGIDVERVTRVVWAVGSALAGLAGILLGTSQQVQYTMGSSILLLMFAAVTLGGLGSATGALIGSIAVGVSIQLSTLSVSPELKYVGALAMLIVVLLVRPQGILGRAERVG